MDKRGELAAAEKRLRRMLKAKAPRGPVATVEAATAELRATGETVKRLRGEVMALDARAAIEAIPARRELELAEREKAKERKAREPGRKAAQKILAFAHPELNGAILAPSNLTADQGVELLQLVEDRREGQLPAKQEDRYQRLVGLLADQPDIFQRKRREADAAAAAAEAEKARLDAIPARSFSGRGGVYLPGNVFAWLWDERDGAMTVVDAGVLALLLFAFEHGQSPFVRSEMIDGDIVLDAAAGFQLARRLNRDGELSALAVRHSVHFLAKNSWFQTDTSEGRIRLRLGERATKLLEEATVGVP